MRRVVGIPMSLPGALHTVASQHMSTLHNASGTHILRYAPAQVKHHLFATSLLVLHATRFSGRRRAHFDRRDVSRVTCHAQFLAICRVAAEVIATW